MEQSKYRWTLSGVCMCTLSLVQSSAAQLQRERVRFKEREHGEKDSKNVINGVFELFRIRDIK